MDGYSIGEALLRGAPRRLAQGAVLVFVFALWSQARWALTLLDGYVQHRSETIVRTVQDAVERLAPPAPTAPVKTG